MKRAALLLILSPLAIAQDIDLPHTLSNNSVANADQVMANFNALRDGVNSKVSVDLTNENIAVGNGLQNLTPGTPETYSGSWNTASGIGALYLNTTGYFNTGTGYKALYNTTGSSNTASGSYALQQNTVGTGNTASGAFALEENTVGINNTASGAFALNKNTEGDYNTASGFNALFYNTTGSHNTASGAYALRDNTEGSQNTAIGQYADVTTGNLQNATAIGYNAKVNANDKIQLGNTAVTSVATSGQLTTGTVTYPNTMGTVGTVLGVDINGELSWLTSDGIAANFPRELEEQIAALQGQLRQQQEELLAIVQSQQEQIAQLQRMVEHQFAMN